MTLEELKVYLKDNLKVNIESKEKGRYCGEYLHVKVTLTLEDEVISESEMDPIELKEYDMD